MNLQRYVQWNSCLMGFRKTEALQLVKKATSLVGLYTLREWGKWYSADGPVDGMGSKPRWQLGSSGGGWLFSIKLLLFSQTPQYKILSSPRMFYENV